jgi:hypothetical protein
LATNATTLLVRSRPEVSSRQSWAGPVRGKPAGRACAAGRRTGVFPRVDLPACQPRRSSATGFVRGAGLALDRRPTVEVDLGPLARRGGPALRAETDEDFVSSKRANICPCDISPTLLARRSLPLEDFKQSLLTIRKPNFFATTSARKIAREPNPVGVSSLSRRGRCHVARNARRRRAR